MATRYEHSGNAVPTTLASDIDADDTAITIDDATGWPTGGVGPFWVTIAAGTADEEHVLVATRSGTVLTLSERNAEGTAQVGHLEGVAIIHSFSATEADDANDLAADVTTLGGTVVTTTAAQTLTDKDIDLEDNTVTGTKAQFNAAVTDADFATLDGVETVTNKDLSSATNTFDTAWPLGTLGYAEATANQESITTAADLTGLSVTVTVATSRRIRVTGNVILSSNVAADEVACYIKEGATQKQLSAETVDVAARGITLQPVVILTPSAGAHTYKLQAARATGTGNVGLTATSAVPAFILVEDIGEA